jgi:transcriptional regulator with XRE-family HTH domain
METTYLDHSMSFKDNLVKYRKQSQLLQRELAEKAAISVEQIKKYEAGKSQPTLDVIKRLSQTLGIPSDTLIFDDNERAPSNARLLSQFQTISNFTAQEQEHIAIFLDAYIKKHRFEEMMQSG